MLTSYKKVRHEAALAELDNWVRVEVSGSESVQALDSIVGGNILDLFEGNAINTLIPSLDGGVEAIVWIVSVADKFMVIAEPQEASVVSRILNELTNNFDIVVRNLNEEQFHLMLTGPEAEEIAKTALGDDVLSITFLSAMRLSSEILAIRIGYFGEYELHLFGSMSHKQQIIDKVNGSCDKDLFVDQSEFPVLMAEMRVLNRSRDIVPEASIFEVALQWMVDFRKDNLRAKEALNVRRNEIKMACVMMITDSKKINTKEVLVENKKIGFIQTSYISPTLNKTIALAYLDADLAASGLIFNTSIGIVKTVSAPAFLTKSITNTLDV